jgi:hypothetical protein
MENNYQTRKITQIKLKAFIYDFYAKTQTGIKFNLNDLLSYHNLGKSVYGGLSDMYKKIPTQYGGSKYIWIGNPPTEQDIILISNKICKIRKEYKHKYNNENKSILNKIDFPSDEQPDIELLKNQMSMLQDMFSKFIK